MTPQRKRKRIVLGANYPSWLKDYIQDAIDKNRICVAIKYRLILEEI